MIYFCNVKNGKTTFLDTKTFGEVAEWSIAPVLKTDVLRGTGGSNPSLSARKRKLKASFFALEGMRTPEWGFVIDEVACQSKNRLNVKF